MESLYLYQYVLALLITVIASNGFWMVFSKKLDKKDARTKLLLGVAHDKIYYLTTLYVDRGRITKDELINLEKYLVEPYLALGGNGIIKRMMNKIELLDVKEEDNG